VRLDFMMLARAANASEGEINVLGGALRRIDVPGFPSFVPIAVAGRLVADIEERGTHHDLTLRVFAPEDEEPFFDPPPIGFDLNLPTTIDSVEESEIGVVVGIEVGAIRVVREGVYRFEVVLDGETLTILPLSVVTHSESPESPA
jgi:hypothetical protein